MLESLATKWIDLRKSGRRQFVLRYGVLGWGIPTAIMFSGLELHHEGWCSFFVNLPIALVLFPLAGILWGRIMWWYMERMHRHAVSE